MPHPRTLYHHTRILTPRSYAPRGYVPAAFKETVMAERISSGYLTAWEADLMIGRAAAKGCLIQAREYGALAISGRRRDGTRLRGYGRTLEMAVQPKAMTVRQFEDLVRLERAEHRAAIVRDGQGFIAAVDAGFHRIARTQVSIFLDRGWLAMPPHRDRVWISAAGRMAMAWYWHRGEALSSRLLKGLYVDAALTAAQTARAELDGRRPNERPEIAAAPTRRGGPDTRHW